MRWLRGQRGFTLLEVILAMGILGIVGVAFMSTLNTGTRTTGTLKEQTQAEVLARSQLEEIKNIPYETDSGCYTLGDPAYPCYDKTITTPPDYTLSVTTEPLDFPGDNALQKITVGVSRTGSGKPILSLTTYKKK